MFITFEGIDGCGKTTQMELAYKLLKDLGREIIAVREPGSTNFSEKIRDLLLDSSLEINSISELMLFQSARADLTKKVIMPAIDSNKIVLCDRYYDSTTAYQGYGRGIDLKAIEKTNYLASFGLVPDITFFFDVSWEVSMARRKNDIKDRMEAQEKEFFDKVASGYKELAKNNSRFITLGADGDPKTIHTKVVSKINKKYKSLNK